MSFVGSLWRHNGSAVELHYKILHSNSGSAAERGIYSAFRSGTTLASPIVPLLGAPARINSQPVLRQESS
jgi:hypothetical protein